MPVDVILPVLDEEGSLPWVLQQMPVGFSPIVVDNGSKDRSVDVALAHGARVVHAPIRGYGAAVQAGLAASTSDVVAFMDADATLDPGDLPRLLRVLESGADMVVGRRCPDRGAWSLVPRLGNRFLAWRLARTSRMSIHDLGPVRVVRRKDLVDLGVTDQRFGYPLELFVRAGQERWRVVEEPVRYRRRSAGRSKVSGSVMGTVRAVRDMLRVLREVR